MIFPNMKSSTFGFLGNVPLLEPVEGGRSLELDADLSLSLGELILSTISESGTACPECPIKRQTSRVSYNIRQAMSVHILISFYMELIYFTIEKDEGNE